MRLLNTTTLKLEEFFGSDVPLYAILSHRWESREVSFQDLQARRGVKMKGYSKIRGCCKQAALDGWAYAWVDSCCIDKSSSSELSEAINSMFMWYREARVCYVYLSDVTYSGINSSADTNPHEPNSAFRRSAWFSRGWTLQELLAPSFVVFFDSQWTDIGTKTSLNVPLREITGIHDFDHFEKACVAQKMSWASYRRTTRVEDAAYCLMGLFDVNMPTLYGEGPKAFLRLQLEILNRSSDESIFAWTEDYGRFRNVKDYRGLLAESPRAFSTCQNVERCELGSKRPPYSMTNQGLRMEHFLLHSDYTHHREIDDEYFLSGYSLSVLNCRQKGSKNYIAIALCSESDTKGGETEDTSMMKRAFPLDMLVEVAPGRISEIRRQIAYVKQREYYSGRRKIDSPAYFLVQVEALLWKEMRVQQYWNVALDDWQTRDRSQSQLELGRGSRAAAIFTKESEDNYTERFAVFIAFDEYPWTYIMELPGESSSADQVLGSFDQNLAMMPRLDRTSKLLGSGSSVSSSINTTNLWGRSFSVFISWDPSGHLPWPEPDRRRKHQIVVSLPKPHIIVKLPPPPQMKENRGEYDGKLS